MRKSNALSVVRPVAMLLRRKDAKAAIPMSPPCLNLTVALCIVSFSIGALELQNMNSGAASE
jgi:hypothetical protein